MVAAHEIARLDYDPIDNSKGIQKAISDPKIRKIVIPNVGLPWYIQQPMFFRKTDCDKHLELEPGVLLLTSYQAFQGRFDSIFTIEADDIRLSGADAEIRMLNGDYQNEELYEISPYRHILHLRGAKNFDIHGLKLSDSGGNAIFLTHGISSAEEIPKNRYCSGQIRHVTVMGSQRQGICICSASELLIESSRFTRSGERDPEAGLEIQPDYNWHVLDKIIFRNCSFESNSGNGVSVNLPYYRGPRANPLDIIFEDCEMTQNRQIGIQIQGTDRSHSSGSKGQLKFDNTWISNNRLNGIYVNNEQPISSETFLTIFEDTIMYMNASEVKDESHQVHQIQLGNEHVSGGIINLDLGTVLMSEATRKSPVKVSYLAQQSGIANISGKIKVECPDGFVEPILGNNYTNLDLVVQAAPPLLD